jgi:hypothetical protein
MKCYLCGLQVQQQERHEGGEEVTCRDCGVYRISAAILRSLGPRQLNFAKMREDLHRQRQANAALVADVNSETAIWA